MKQGYRKSEKLATLSPEQLNELLAQAETEHPLDLLARLGAQAILQAALEAEIELHAGTADQIRVAPLVDELRFFLISGDVKVVPFHGEESRIVARPTTQPKCVRCWQHRADVGSHAEHPLLCGRCVSNVEGPGEDRKWF